MNRQFSPSWLSTEGKCQPLFLLKCQQDFMCTDIVNPPYFWLWFRWTHLHNIYNCFHSLFSSTSMPLTSLLMGKFSTQALKHDLMMEQSYQLTKSLLTLKSCESLKDMFYLVVTEPVEAILFILWTTDKIKTFRKLQPCSSR